MKKTFTILALMLVTACGALSPVPKSVIDDARATSYGLENTYLLALQGATAWATQPRCGRPNSAPPPLCSTAAGVIKLEGYRGQARTALNHLSSVIDGAKDQNTVTLAISAAKAAVAAYNDISKGD